MFLFSIIIFVICIIVLILSSNKISYANNYVKVYLNIIRLFKESKIYNSSILDLDYIKLCINPNL